MIAGILFIVAVMAIRLGSLGGSAPVPPVSAEALTLPAGVEIVAIGRGGGEVMVITRDASGAEMLRLLDPATGAERRAVPIRRE